MITGDRRDILISLTIFLTGGAFSALLMYYTALSKNYTGLWNDSIFLVAIFFGIAAAGSLIAHYILGVYHLRKEIKS